jgi:hypothetical protein
VYASVAEVRAYVDRVLRSRLDGALVHEAAFLYECADPAGMWQEIRRLTQPG